MAGSNDDAEIACAPDRFPPNGSRSSRGTCPTTPTYRKTDRRELQGLTQVFLDEKNFEGCGGLALTDEIKVTIATQACVLLIHREGAFFSRLISILVYPAAYFAKTVEPLGGGTVLESEQVRLGEAWKDGVAIVSWDDVRATALGQNYGKNLVLHEFAHLLDMEDGAADGTPILESRDRYGSWSRVLGEEFERLKRDHVLGRYARSGYVRCDQSRRVLRRGDGSVLREARSAPEAAPGTLRAVEILLQAGPGPTAAAWENRPSDLDRNLPDPLSPFMDFWGFSSDPERRWRIDRDLFLDLDAPDH